MCKKSKKVKYSKYAQIIDASFKNAVSFHNSIEYNRNRENPKGQIQELRSTNDEWDGVKEKNFIEKQAERRKKQIEAEYAVVLPILEGFTERLMKKIVDAAKEIESIKSGVVQTA
jgi:hypothetical protein